MESNSRDQKSSFEQNPFKTIACSLALFILILDFSSANIYKLIKGYSFNNRHVEQAKIMARRSRVLAKELRVPSKIYHHGFKKMKSGFFNWGDKEYPVYINSLGFIDKIIREVPLQTNKHRIVFIGDSFTEGVGIPYERTFVGLIINGFDEKYVEVLNASVSSYSPIIYWSKIKYLIEDLGLRFNELVVFLDISDVEDEAIYYALNEAGNVIRYDARQLYEKSENLDKKEEGGRTEWVKIFITDNTILLYFILNYLHDKLINDISSKETKESKYKINFPRSMWTFDDNVYNEYAEVGLKEMRLYMNKLLSLLESNNIKLTVAVYPWPDQIYHNDLNSKHVQAWRNWSEEHEVGFINYFPYFIDSESEESRLKVLDKYFFSGDVHWNEKGHQIIAKIFLENYNINNNKGDSRGQH